MQRDMARLQTQVPDSVRQSIKAGRFAAAAEAKDAAQKAVAADPTFHNARVMLARSHVALDDNEQAIADFKVALTMTRPGQPKAPGGPVPVPAHQALHTLEQLVYIEQAEKRPPGSLLPVDPKVRAAAQGRLEHMLADTAHEIPTLPMGGAYGHILADPPLLRLDEPAPARCPTGASPTTTTARRTSRASCASRRPTAAPSPTARIARCCSTA